SEQHFLHLIRRRERLDQRDGTDDGILEKVQVLLARGKEFLPKAGFSSGFQFREVEINALSAFGLYPARVKQGQGGPEDARRYRHSIYSDIRFIQEQPAFTVHEERQLTRLDPVLFLPLCVVIAQGALDCLFAVPGCPDRVLEAMSCRIL